MKNCLLLMVCLLLGNISVTKAQSSGYDYTTAIGVKIFDGGGITVKHFIAEGTALEAIAYFWTKGTRITGLYEWHFQLGDASGLKWYIGPGVHLGLYNSENGDGSFGGVDGVLGLDYKFNNAPLNLSLDWQPSFEFGDDRGFAGSWGGLGVRYAF